MKEVYKIWKDTTNPNGFGNGVGSLWEVSNLGRIRKNGVNVNGCINKNGYTYICGVDSLHRVVATLFIDNPENKPEVDHIDGNKQNNRADNLRWATSSENKLNVNTNPALHNKHRKCTAEEKQRMSEYRTGRKWMNDGNRNYLIMPNEVQDKLQQGLFLGKVPGSTKQNTKVKMCKWMNDGTNDYLIPAKDFDKELQNGLVFGRLRGLRQKQVI